jgi:hypothetical protein
VCVTFIQGVKRWLVTRKFVKGGADKPAKKTSGGKNQSTKLDIGDDGGAMKLISTLEWQDEGGPWQDFSGVKRTNCLMICLSG